ncbi:hypothetical protein DOY81_009278, partial [Sarcophaga bullata]
MCCRCCSTKQQKIWLFSIGTILVILGIVSLTAWPTIWKAVIEKKLPLRPDSFYYTKWVQTPVPLYLHFFLFNWTNPQQVNDSSVKPNFEQCGPYVFREIKIKEDLKWEDNNNLVTYFSKRTWYFEQSKSIGSLDDLITAPHLPTVGASKVFGKRHRILSKIVNFGLNREGGTLYVTYNVLEWLFQGFYDDLMDFAERLHSPRFPIYYPHFGYYYKRNNSKEAEGTSTIYTGQHDLGKMGDLKYWNGSDHTEYWQGECSRVNGTTGELWAPGKMWHEPVTLFLADAARFINIFPQTNETYRGVEVRRYTSTELTFDSGYMAEDTKCFCVPKRECPKNGVVDYSPVTMGAPIYLSHPHFYMTDPLYRQNTTGLRPDPKQHGTFVLLEPKLSIPMKLEGKIMLSALLERDEELDVFKDLAWNFYAPLISLYMTAEITDDLLRVVKFMLNAPLIGQYIGIVLLGLGLIEVVLVLIKQKPINGMKKLT